MESSTAINESDLIITLLVGVIIFILLATFIIFFVLFYKKRRKDFQKRLNEMEYTFQQEILKTQLEIQEQTFQKISQEIHDNIGQVLTLVKLNLSKLPASEPGRLGSKIKDLEELTGKAISDLRSLSKGLNSERITELGLAKAVEQELQLIERTGSYQVEFILRGSSQHLNPQKELIIFRMIQETLNNIIKHAKANLVRLSLEYDANSLKIIISDNGQGFDTSQHFNNHNAIEGIGLKNMRKRAQLIGATLEVTSAPNTGTAITINIPMEEIETVLSI